MTVKKGDELEPPLTNAELRDFRALNAQDKRVTWLWSSMGVWIKWALIIGAFTTLAWEKMRSALTALKAIIS